MPERNGRHEADGEGNEADEAGAEAHPEETASDTLPVGPEEPVSNDDVTMVSVAAGNGAAAEPPPVVPAPEAEPIQAETTSEVTSEPAPEPVAVVLTPPDPNRPKRAGWWSRTKAALAGD
uniref:hypothetical protein n=1 Tax=Methylobacterium radiotolerans TaxID=31998 RepID=UPI003AF801A2